MSKPVSFTVGGTLYNLAIHNKEGEFHLRGDAAGNPIDMTIAAITSDLPWIDIHADGRVARCAVARDSKGIWITHKGRTYLVERVKPASEGASPSGGSSGEVRAPMTGTVLSVDVAEGEVVSRGTLLAVIEAMKMEYRLEADLAGTIAELACASGDLIDVGTVMIRIKPDDSE